MNSGHSRWGLFAALTVFLLLPAAGLAQHPKPSTAAGSATAAGDIANFFGEVGDQIYEDCIFELSQEQLEVQHALIEAYIKQGATHTLARQLAVKQIHPPKLSDECEQIRSSSKAARPKVVATPSPPKKPTIGAALPKPSSEPPAPTTALADKKVLPLWDCAPGVDYVTIQHKGYERKLTDGEICSPFDDVVRAVPEGLKSFRFGYTIKTGRLFVLADDPQMAGKTIAWAISGREACRNNPDPECLAARAVGPLPPGQYSFASGKESRVSWGPKTKRMVAGIYLTKLWNREKFTPATNRGDPGARQYCRSRAIERRNVRGLPGLGAKRLGVCFLTHQRRTRDRRERLYRRALPTACRNASARQGFVFFSVLAVQVDRLAARRMQCPVIGRPVGALADDARADCCPSRLHL